MISTLYRGSVKDLVGPLETPDGAPALIFEYSDAFSVFDWGRMPDLLPKKGEALAILTADIFEKLGKPEFWRDYSRSPEALALRKGNRFGAIFNELGEDLQFRGLQTHYLGVSRSTKAAPSRVSQIDDPFRCVWVRPVSVVKPTWVSLMGRSLPDYEKTRNSPAPRLVPLEVVFRFSCTDRSSILERTSQDPGYLASLGFPDFKAFAGVQWDFPVLELFTKLETIDRPVSFSEAFAISGLSALQLQEILLRTAWVASILRFWFSKSSLDLIDGKLEWAIAENGECFLVDAIGPDELRLMKNGIHLSKEFLRIYYRETQWFKAMESAKLASKAQGISEWKRKVQESVPLLPPHYRELAVQVYWSLTNQLTGRPWFREAWSLDRVVEGLRGIQ